MASSTAPAASLRFHHLAYAVANIESHLAHFVMPLLDPIHVSTIVEDPIQRVRVCFVTVGGGALIELVEPLGADSPAHAYLGDHRGGLYHVCYEVDNIETTIVRFRTARCLLLSKPVPAVAFGGRRIAFLLTPARDLIELVEVQRE